MNEIFKSCDGHCRGCHVRVAELEREIVDLRGTNRCAVCGWTLVADREHGCVRGDCSMRPRPERLFDPERAKK
jgi:hypothetical protein